MCVWNENVRGTKGFGGGKNLYMQTHPLSISRIHVEPNEVVPIVFKRINRIDAFFRFNYTYTYERTEQTQLIGPQ